MSTASSPVRNLGSSLDFLDVVRRCDVLAPQRVEEIRERVRAGSYPADALNLAARLVKKGVLTTYQARRLLHGQGEGLAIDRYIVLDRLGRGAMGKVYKARHRFMGRIVALKFITREYLTRPNALPRFLREMRVVGRLDHPNIVRALDAEEIGHDPCIVMEYVPGRDLEQLLNARGPLPPGDVARWGLEAALGLAHAHAQGVIHRDIKPSNLLLGDDGRIRILDLGLATLIDDPDADLSTVKTSDGGAVGTADYMSPEQATAREPLDARTDLYSLGCVLYHLLTGTVPFPEPSRIECMASRIKGRPAPIAVRRPGVPPALVAVVDRLMSTRPEDRYATATDAAEALRAVVLTLAPNPSEPPPPPPTASLRGPAPPPVVSPTAASSGSISLETPAVVADLALPHSASAAPQARPGFWLRLLSRLAGWPPWLGLLATSAVLAMTFASGVLASLALR
jgi:serine/threonine-protein kinase